MLHFWLTLMFVNEHITFLNLDRRVRWRPQDWISSASSATDICQTNKINIEKQSIFSVYYFPLPYIAYLAPYFKIFPSYKLDSKLIYNEFLDTTFSNERKKNERVPQNRLLPCNEFNYLVSIFFWELTSLSLNFQAEMHPVQSPLMDYPISF